MMNDETYARIKQYHPNRLKARQIAQKLSLEARTIQSGLEEPPYRQRKSAGFSSKLEPDKETVVSLLERHSYTATQLFQRLQEDRYDGRYSLLKGDVRKVRPKRPPAFLTRAFAPGECAQVDWGIDKTIDVGATPRQLSFLVMVLCHSRMRYVEFTLSQSVEHFLACHQHAFDFFGAVPQNMMIDNLKTGVLKRVTGQDRVFNPKYLDFSHHSGFTIKACGVRKGNEKGRVENAVGVGQKKRPEGTGLNAV